MGTTGPADFHNRSWILPKRTCRAQHPGSGPTTGPSPTFRAAVAIAPRARCPAVAVRHIGSPQRTTGLGTGDRLHLPMMGKGDSGAGCCSASRLRGDKVRREVRVTEALLPKDALRQGAAPSRSQDEAKGVGQSVQPVIKGAKKCPGFPPTTGRSPGETQAASATGTRRARGLGSSDGRNR